jgi:hypothetical protein
LQALANLVKQQELMLQQLQLLNLTDAAQQQQQEEQQQLSAGAPGQQQQQQQHQPAADAAACTADHTSTCNGSSSSDKQLNSAATACRKVTAYKSPFMLRHDELETLLNKSSAGTPTNNSSSSNEAAEVAGGDPSSQGAASCWQSPFSLPADAAANAAGAGQLQQSTPQHGYAFQLLQQATAEQWERVASMTAVVSSRGCRMSMLCCRASCTLYSQ